MHGFIDEDVYEAAHLEILPPSQKASLSDLSSQDADGLWRVTCMNTQQTMLLYNDPKHWNSSLRDDFFRSTLNMWDKSYYGYNRQEEADNNRRWREEAEASLNQEALPKY